MWADKKNTARSAAETFLQLMKERPTSWSDNILRSVEGLNDPDQQMQFLAWLADPQNRCGNRDRTFEQGTIDSKECFENHPDFKVTKTTPGYVPTVHVSYKPNGCTECVLDDEKAFSL